MEHSKRAFCRQDLFITDSTPSMPHDENRRVYGVHYGHWKLTMADICLLIYWWNPSKVKKPVLVAAGAAPGNHYAVILRMFPTLTIHLYDTNTFFTEKYGNEQYAEEFAGRIFLYKQYFTDEDAKFWKGRDDVFFTSDIRSVSHEDVTPEVYYEAITADNRRQEDWVRVIDPVAAMLKFRLPELRTSNISEMTSIAYKGMDGFVLKGIWARPKTTECRLVPIKKDGKYVERIWDSAIYREQNLFNNYVLRSPEAFINNYTGDTTELIPDELINDYDSLATVYILDEYLRKVGVEEPTSNDVLALYRSIDQMLKGIGRTNLSIADLRTTYWRSTGRPDDIDYENYMQRWNVDLKKEIEFISSKRWPKKQQTKEDRSKPIPKRGRGGLVARRGRGRSEARVQLKESPARKKGEKEREKEEEIPE